MSFSVGIVGLPNVGKSTLFKALTKKQVDISNYPFCTISPNVGVVKVPDQRLDKLAEILKPKEVLPTTIEFVDIAGLVKGAHRGEGLGNQFLARIREVDAICHLIRSFEDANITHVSGKIEPKSDQEIVNLELIFVDMATVEKRLSELEKKAKGGLEKLEAKTLEVVKKIKTGLDQGKLASNLNLSEEEKDLIKDLNLLTIKPILYVINVGEKDLYDPQVGTPTYKLQPSQIPVCCKLEMELAELLEEEAKEYLKEYGLEKSGMDELITASYKLLDLITFFTCQNQILQAWTVRREAKAPEAAGRVHTDFEKNFIRAEVINWQDLIQSGSEITAREKGILCTEGKEYIVQDGDVMHFKFAT